MAAYLGVPVRDADGSVLGSFCAIDRTPREWSDRERSLLEKIAVGVESEIALRRELRRRRHAEQQTKVSEERLRRALDAGRLGTFDFDPRSHELRWDEAMFALWWIDPSEPEVFLVAQSRVHPLDKEAEERARAEALDLYGSSGTYEIELRIVHPTTNEIRWLHIDADIEFDGGEASRVVGTARDVTDRRQAQETNVLLAEELNHRVKNLFAITAGMVSLTARSSESPVEMGRALRGRIEALAVAHELIEPKISVEATTEQVTTLHELVSRVLSPHMTSEVEVTFDGPAVEIGARSASSLSLILYELATNAAKYGVWRGSSGLLSVSWSLDDSTADPSFLELRWKETGAPEHGSASEKQGFGTALIDLTVRGQLLGEWSRNRSRDGMETILRLPLARISD